jgi:tetratricopeptide (TPR) repeat protein
VRSQLLAADPPAPPVPRRRFLAVAATALAVLAVAGGGITYFAVRRAHRSEDARALVESARRGLLRDTAGSVRDAARALAAARQLEPGAPEPRELAAVAGALLWSDSGDRAGRDLAAGLLAAGDAGDASPVVRALLAATPAERTEALAVLAGAPASRHVPAEAAAARLLLGRGDDTAALGRLEAAARSTPPSLRALAALGDHALRAGAPEDALRWHLAALAAHSTHPGAAAGAGEARLALRRDVPAAIAALRGVEGDPDSAPSASERLRLEIVTARLLAVDGQRAAALERLDRAEEREPSAPDVPMAMAEMLLESGACDRAEPEARRALALAGGGSGRARLLVARAQLCLGRDRELLRGTEGAASREIRLLRAQARLAAGDARGALGELEATGRGGRMAADAAGWYAIALEASGRSGQARATVARLLALARPPVPALLAAAAVARGAGRLDEAERHLRTAVERDALPSPDPEAVEPHCALGRLLLARGRVPEGITELARAAAWNPFHAEAQVALGDARLAVGDAAGARDAFRAAAAAAPADGPALRGLARAWLAAGDPLEARRAADRAVAADPGSAQSWLVAAQVALAQGDRRAAQRFAEKARRLDGGGAAGAEAKRILARARG